MNLNKNSNCWYDQHTYNTLPKVFYQAISPNPSINPQIILLNEDLIDEYELPSKDEFDYLTHLSGNAKYPNAIAQSYAGHQFGGFSMLGDGRAHILGEFTGWKKHYDLQLKGSGQTRFSRRGDGKATLSAMLREYLISEAMHALHIPTTRSLAVLTTGEQVQREMVQPGAILARTALSHIRVGSCQFASMQTPEEHLAFIDYAIQRHNPVCRKADQPYLCFLSQVIDKQAKLIAKWMSVGFIHGVMNTDNMLISGETIDYGPCAFLDAYHPETVYSSIDRGGRYKFMNQPIAAQWNLARFAETLLPFLDSDKEKAIKIATKEINTFLELYEGYWFEEMKRKLGLQTSQVGDLKLLKDMLDHMDIDGIDYTNHFRVLSYDLPRTDYVGGRWDNWFTQYETRLSLEKNPKELMKKVNPNVIPRNHLVEKALYDAQDGNLLTFQELLKELKNPFSEELRDKKYYESNPNDASFVTYCGT